MKTEKWSYWTAFYFCKTFLFVHPPYSFFLGFISFTTVGYGSVVLDYFD